MTERVDLLDGCVTLYTLSDGYGHVRYVGKTARDVRRRLIEHCRGARRPSHLPVRRWIAKMLNAGHKPVLRIVGIAGADWADRERLLIEQYREAGHDLLNLTDGGEGLAGHQFTPEHRAKIGAAQFTNGATFACIQCGTEFWRKGRDIAKGHNKFCSRDCYHASTKGVSKPFSRIAIERGVAAAAAKAKHKSHCKRGHPLSGENLRMNTAGSRVCRACMTIHKHAYRRRLREQMA